MILNLVHTSEDVFTKVNFLLVSTCTVLHNLFKRHLVMNDLGRNPAAIAFDNLMSLIQNDFCNSHCLSQLAAVFIDLGAKISTGKCFESLSLQVAIRIQHVLLREPYLHQVFFTYCNVSIQFSCNSEEKEINFGNDPAAGSPTATLLRLLLPLT